MKTMVTISLLLNIAVLIPVCSGIITSASWALSSYGGESHTRGILLAVYISILITSAVLLMFRDPRPVAALLIVQIIYKLITPLTVGFQDPVVISNVLIAAVHTVTLMFIWKAISNPFRASSQ